MHQLFLILGFILLSTATLSAKVPDWDDTADSGTYTGKDTTIATGKTISTILVLTEEPKSVDGTQQTSEPTNNPRRN